MSAESLGAALEKGVDMGLFGRKKGGVPGTAQVVRSRQAPHAAAMGMADIDVVIQAEGVPAFSAHWSGLAKVSTWPMPGMQLPVLLDPDDPQKFEILWKEVQTGPARGQATAEALAAVLRGEAGAAAAVQGTGAQVNVVAANTGEDPVARLEKLGKLKTSGLINDEQFESLKAQILGQAGI